MAKHSDKIEKFYADLRAIEDKARLLRLKAVDMFPHCEQYGVYGLLFTMGTAAEEARLMTEVMLEETG